MTLTPKIQLHIDLDEDGVFESGEDVSADFLSYSVHRGVEISQHKAAAAQLDLTLNNTAHKYSPSNSSSPLYPFTLPGPAIRLRAGWPYDSFDGTNGTSISGRTPDIGGELGNWAMSGPGGLVILSNEMTINGVGQHFAVLDYGTPNVVLAARVHRPTISSFPYTQSIFVVRYSDTSNWAQLRLEQTTANSPVRLQFQNKVAGVADGAPAILENVTVWPENDYADVICAVKDNRVEVIIGSTGNQAGALNTLDPSLDTNTKHGIGGPDFTSDAPNGGATWNDFGLITQFVGRVDLVEPRVQDGAVTAFIRAYDDMERMANHVLFTGTTDLIPASSGDIASRILTRANFAGGSIVDTGVDPITPAQVDTGNNQNGVPVDTGTVMGGNALNEMYQLQDDEVGRFYIDRWGVARFESSDHREENDHIAAIAEWRDTSDSGYPYIREPVDWDAGIERVENRVFYKYFRFAKTLSTTVWFLEPDDDPQFVSTRKHPNDSNFMAIDIVAIGEELGIASPKVPIPGTDYTVYENADGTGTNWLTPILSETGTVSATGSPDYQLDDTGRNFQSDSSSLGGITWGALTNMIVIQDASGNTAVAYIDTEDPDGDGTRINLRSYPEDAADTAGYLSMDAGFDETDTPLTYDVLVVVAYILPGFEGNFQTLRFTANGNLLLGSTPTAYVTSAKIQADKLSASVPAAVRAEDSTSISTYLRRQISHDTKHIRDWDTAQGRAEKRIELRKDARERFVCHMRNTSPENVMEMLFREVSDRVSIVYSDMGVDRDHYIENYRTTYSQQSGSLETRWEATRVTPSTGINYRVDAADALVDTATAA